MEDLHDVVARFSLETFYKKLPKTGKPNEKEWTVLSTIVKYNEGEYEVVSMGTGSKCIGHTKMSMEGNVLNDSHAEVICRRGFMRYLYYEILDVIEGKETTFKYNESTKKFYLKDSVVFHFFTTLVPCGDASIFPKQDSSDFGDSLLLTVKRETSKEDNTDYEPICKKLKMVDDSKNLNREDIYRTGAKCLPNDLKSDPLEDGVLYHTIGLVRTKPGRGVRTLSVSCSDKLARWHHLGVQGALLSLLIEQKITFKSFTIAGSTPFSKEALERALYKRIDIIKDSFNSNKTNEIDLGQSKLSFIYQKTQEKQPSPSSISWSKLKNCPLEVAVEGYKQGVTKKKRNNSAGRLKITKKEIFSLFLDTIEKLKQNNMCPLKDDVGHMSYIEVKQSSTKYQNEWRALKLEGFKIWTEKDIKYLQFYK